jgi:hypothetical protein
VTEFRQMRTEGPSRANVVGPYDRDIGQRFVGSDRHDRYLGIQGGPHQCLVPPVALRDDQPIDPSILNPLVRDRRVVGIPQFEAQEHQTHVARLELLLHAGEQLREPGILNGIDDHTDAAFEAEAQISRRSRRFVAERLDDL